MVGGCKGRKRTGLCGIPFQRVIEKMTALFGLIYDAFLFAYHMIFVKLCRMRAVDAAAVFCGVK